ncbi:MAG: hypothetical protein ACQET0_10170 [Pseudomonadota bacterium]
MKRQGWQIVGLLMWRGGMTFVLAYGFYHGAWRVLRQLAWPPQLTVGAAIALAGFCLVIFSLMAERRKAAREEGNLLDD